jgi:methionine-rich copper-binding protein CopC
MNILNFSLFRKILILYILILPLFIASAAPTLAHGSYSTNLENQSFAVAPDTADFMFDTEIDLSSVKGQLRFLGDLEASTDVYFKTDVPTTTLILLENPEGTNTKFSLKLPPLEKGLYALDWKATPVNDHETESIQLFKVTEGVSTETALPIIAIALLTGVLLIILIIIFLTTRKEEKS